MTGSLTDNALSSSLLSDYGDSAFIDTYLSAAGLEAEQKKSN